MSSHSTKPYLIRAIHEWCSDQGHTPYLAVAVDEHTIVPMEYVKGGEIVLNVSLAATNRLRLGNDWIEFQARFGGVARDISIPISHVSAIYARETGHGMAFEVSKPQALLSAVDRSKSQAALPSPDEAHPQVGTGSPVSRAPNQLAAVPAAEPAISETGSDLGKRMRSVSSRRQPAKATAEKSAASSKKALKAVSPSEHPSGRDDDSPQGGTQPERARGGARSSTKARPKLTRVK
ncbi:MAG: ClpXP protease specificity-enhancing factor [Betaproteobacteria bacterium]|nr:ClpXP protease specificity-enhancing factor [Betaproteobacteria bacterium]NCX11377.1 ClpXP protease specificity-enhancing factor [Betaproteobacteria bacterium]NCX72011.1 ClpXP protease specificity-enhancing factor [Betaproteobacteria bacterium]NCZ99841.1 ClpXP protease specificity-enhancing factor [Betaproteobacteria bacterium]NDA22971.1 ClpXP protease specificity-enhancing factor [Betaproteobacteria bacterium]